MIQVLRPRLDLRHGEPAGNGGDEGAHTLLQAFRPQVPVVDQDPSLMEQPDEQMVSRTGVLENGSLARQRGECCWQRQARRGRFRQGTGAFDDLERCQTVHSRRFEQKHLIVEVLDALGDGNPHGGVGQRIPPAFEEPQRLLQVLLRLGRAAGIPFGVEASEIGSRQVQVELAFAIGADGFRQDLHRGCGVDPPPDFPFDVLEIDRQTLPDKIIRSPQVHAHGLQEVAPGRREVVRRQVDLAPPEEGLRESLWQTGAFAEHHVLVQQIDARAGRALFGGGPSCLPEKSVEAYRSPVGIQVLSRPIPIPPSRGGLAEQANVLAHQCEGKTQVLPLSPILEGGYRVEEPGQRLRELPSPQPH